MQISDRSDLVNNCVNWTETWHRYHPLWTVWNSAVIELKLAIHDQLGVCAPAVAVSWFGSQLEFIIIECIQSNKNCHNDAITNRQFLTVQCKLASFRWVANQMGQQLYEYVGTRYHTSHWRTHLYWMHRFASDCWLNLLYRSAQVIWVKSRQLVHRNSILAVTRYFQCLHFNWTANHRELVIELQNHTTAPTAKCGNTERG